MMSGAGPEYLARSTLGGKPLPFSSAVRVGEVLYLSGQMGFREDGTLAEGMEGQTRQALENVRAVLSSAGLEFNDVFHCTVMLADMGQWAAFNAVYLEYFGDPLPTRSAFGVSALALGGVVEIECQAYARQK
ncbi:MAG TPA: RidA family protein [Sphingomicrobium sp.]|nr:RidA family protein [Sphingomicrobium sp.]